MNDTSDFYFQSYAEWHQAITERCSIKLSADYVATRVDALSDSNGREAKEFADKYGEPYLQQVIQWFKQSQ